MSEKIEIKPNERIDDLEYNNLKIIQNLDGFCFGMDSILLTDFAKNDIRNYSTVLDLGTGTGILPILLSEKTNLKKIYGVEIQSEMAEMAIRSVKLNNLENKIEIINENILNLSKILEINSFDSIVTNPPYKKINTGIVNENQMKLISRHEIAANLEDFIRISSQMLKGNGSIFMVHRSERLVDIMFLLRKFNLEPKKLRIVYSSLGKESKLILIKAVKNGKSFLQIDKPLYIYDNNGNYTEEIMKIYNKI